MQALRLLLAVAVAAVVARGLPFAPQELRAQQEALASHQTASAQSGVAVSEPAPMSREMAGLPQLSASDSQANTVPATLMAGLSEAVYRARKAAAANAPSSDGGLTGDAPAPANGEAASDGVEIQTPGHTKAYEGISLNQCGGISSGHGLAVGPVYLVQAVNNCLLVMNKKTGVIAAGFPKGLNTFFGAGATTLLYPRVLYDQIGKRFLIVAQQYNTATGFAMMWVAISKNNNPTEAWWIYSLGVDTAVAGDLPDFPTLGVDSEIIYLCADVFRAAGGLTSVCKFLPKVKMYKGQAIGTYYFGVNFSVGGINLDSLQPANHGAFSKDNPRAGFLVASRNRNFGGGQCVNGCNGVVLFAISNALFVQGGPGVRISGINLPTANNYFFPPNALQPGCTSPIDACAVNTLDTRISGQVTYTNGSLWASLNTKRIGNNTSTVLWFQLRPFLNDGDTSCTGAFAFKCAQITAAELLNEDCYFCGGRGNSGSDWNAVPVSNSEGDVTMVASYSDLSNYPGIFYVSRRVTQAKNTMRDVGLYLMNGQAFYQILDQYGRNVWGWYSAAQVDSTDELWFAAQYARAPSSMWGTKIGKNAFTARNQP